MKRTAGSGSKPAARRRAGVRADLAESASLRADLAHALESPAKTTAAAPIPAADVHQRGVTWATAHELQAFQGVACAVTAELDMGRLVRRILDEAVRALAADRAILFLGRTGGELVPVAARDIRSEDLPAVTRVSRTILASARAGETILTRDALTDRRFTGIESIATNRMRSILCAPLIAPSGQVGVLYLDAASASAFPDEVLPFVASTARIAGIALERAEVHGRMIRENDRLRRSAAHDPVDRLVGISPAIESLRRQAAILAAGDQPLLIVGEPGSGKRLLARVLHDASRRAAGPFITCDCSAFPPRLLGGIIFGGRASRGLAADRGVLGLARGGTLYLTNADLLGSDLSQKLHDLILAGSAPKRRRGRSTDPGVRLLVSRSVLPAELSPSLQSWGKLGELLGECPLLIPPLRERTEDLLPLILHAAERVDWARKGRGRLQITPEALAILKGHPWPGNVRQLEQAVLHMLLYCPGALVDDEMVRQAIDSDAARADSPGGVFSGPIRPLREMEDEAIGRALLATKGNRIVAAKLLGIHRNTLNLKLKAMGAAGTETQKGTGASSSRKERPAASSRRPRGRGQDSET